MTNVPRIDQLASRLLEAKEELAIAQALVREIEDDIISIFGNDTEGTITFTGEAYALQTVGTITRTLANIDRLRAQVNPVVFDTLITYKPTLNVAAYKKLSYLDPNSAAIARNQISEKPAKTAVKVRIL